MWAQGFGTRHLEGPKNPDGLNFGIYVFVYVYKVHMCIFLQGSGMRFLDQLSAFFLYGIFASEKDKQKK